MMLEICAHDPGAMALREQACRHALAAADIQEPLVRESQTRNELLHMARSARRHETLAPDEVHGGKHGSIVFIAMAHLRQ
ncbi:MAG: hypothetical protein RIC38_02025 [Chromatocurvus sp.]